MAINQGSILDHIDKPAIHPDDAVYQSLTPTSDGKIEITVNGEGVTDRVHALMVQVFMINPLMMTLFRLTLVTVP